MCLLLAGYQIVATLQYEIFYCAKAAKSKLIDQVAGNKSAIVKDVMKGNINSDSLKGLLGTKKSTDDKAKTDEKPAKKLIKNLLNF